MNVTLWSPYQGAGETVRGVALGLPVTGAKEIDGVATSVFGVEADDRIGSIHGIAIGGVGAGAGGDVVGLALAGVGLGAGGAIRGIAISGVGLGAPRLSGGFAALAVGARDASGVVLAPAFFRIEREGSFSGVSASAVNYIRGAQAGLAIGLFNYARSLNGVQLGIINIVSDAKSHPVMPLINWGSGRE